MKTKSEISDLLILICDFYNSYRTILEYSHEEAKSRILNKIGRASCRERV